MFGQVILLKAALLCQHAHLVGQPDAWADACKYASKQHDAWADAWADACVYGSKQHDSVVPTCDA